MENKLEYVKLVFYQDKSNNDKSWGEVYYKINDDDTNKVIRTYKEKVNKRDFYLCLKAFRLQEGTNALPFEKYQIYDAKSGKVLNMPYYLKEESKLEKIGDSVRNGLAKTSNTIADVNFWIDSLKRRDVKEIDKSLLYSIKEGINDIKGNNKITKKYRKENNKRLFVRITSIATATVLLSALADYEIKRHKIDFSNVVYVTKLNNSTNYLDNEIRKNYYKFEDIIERLTRGEYDNISVEDIRFVNEYIYQLSKASNDSLNNGNFYDFNYLNYLDKESQDYKFFLSNSYDYNMILKNDYYKTSNAYEYCARGCNVLYYTISALTMNRSSYMPSKNDIYAFNRMSPLSKIVFLNQLKGVVSATNFTYKKGDEPYWWLALSMNTNSLIDKIDSMIEICNENLKSDVFNKNNKVK